MIVSTSQQGGACTWECQEPCCRTGSTCRQFCKTYVVLQDWSRQPTPLEIAKEVDQPLSRVVLALGNVKNPVAIEAQPDDDDKDGLVDLLAASIDEPADEDSRSVAMSTS